MRYNPLNIVDRFLNWSLPLLITLVTLLVFLQAVLRYVFHAPLMGIEELLMFPTTWLYMLGAIKASSEKTQIVARVAEIFCKKQRSVYILRAAGSFISSLVLVWLMKWGYDFFRYSLHVWKESPTMYIPTFYYEGVVFISLIFVLIYTAAEMTEYIFLAAKTSATQMVDKREG